MIDDLSLTLKAVLKDPTFTTVFPELANADIVFDRPVDPFTPPKTTVDLFLYDLRENLELRSNEYTVTVVNNQAITHPAALRLACSYLVTAWPVGGLDLPLQEHRLLTQVLRVLSRYPTIPNNFLKGSLATGQDPPLPMVALHPDALKNLAEFWSSLGSKIKASLTVTVTISVPVFADATDFLVTTHVTNYAPADATPPEPRFQIGGRILDQTATGVPGALVEVEDSGLHQTTDQDGFYAFPTVAAGPHNFRVVAVGFQPQAQNVTVPGVPEDYVIRLTPL